MFPMIVVFAGFAAARPTAAPYPRNGTATTLVTRTVTTTNATTTAATRAAVAPVPNIAATAIAIVPGAFAGPGQNAAKPSVVVAPTAAVLTPLRELTHIVERVSDHVFVVTRFVRQTIERHSIRISEEHDHTIADVVSLPMSLLHSLLDHVTAHVRHMCHRSGHLLTELPVGPHANSTAVAGARPEVLAVMDTTGRMVAEIRGTAHHLIEALGLTHVAEVVHPVLVAAEELMGALEAQLLGTHGTHSTHSSNGAAASSSHPSSSGCEECDEDDEDADECCSSSGHGGLRHSIKSRLRGMAVRYLHRHFRSILRFLLGDLEDIIDDAERYYEEAYDGPDVAAPQPTTTDGGSCDPQALGLLMDHIDKVGEAVRMIKSTWRSPEAIEDFFADKGAEAEA